MVTATTAAMSLSLLQLLLTLLLAPPFHCKMGAGLHPLERLSGMKCNIDFNFFESEINSAKQENHFVDP
jgi:hypothetical protein